MADLIGLALGTVGWTVGVLMLVVMALLPVLEQVETRRDRAGQR